MTTNKDVLIAARAYLSNEKCWFNAQTRGVHPDVNVGDRHCAYTAIVNEYYKANKKVASYNELEEMVRTAFGCSVSQLWELNDHHLTHEQLLELMDMGINNVQ